jgi:hypothetical protein
LDEQDAATARDGEIERDDRRAPVAAIASRPTAPFDLERDGDGLADLQPAVAPFDLERESVRAA